MEIKPTSTNLPGDMTQPQAKEERAEPIRDTFAFSEKDLSGDGKLTLIIQSGEKLSTRDLKNQCKKSGLGKCKEDLEIVDGFTYEIDPEDLPEFLKTLPEDAEVSVDRKVQFF